MTGRGPEDGGTKPATTGTDTALAAFMVIAQRQGASLTVESLRALGGLGTGPATLPALAKLADRAGFRAKSTRLKWKHLETLGAAYPVVLRLTSGSCVIAERFVRDGETSAILVRDPTQPNAPPVPIDELRLVAAWDGEALLVRRRYRSMDDAKPFGFGYMLSVVMMEARLFRDVAVAALVLAALALVPPMLYMIVIDKVLVHQRMSTLTVVFGAVLVVLVFETMLGYIRRSLVAVATARIDARVSTAIFDRMIGLPIDFFDHNATGIVAYKLGEARRIRTFLTGQLFNTLLDATTLLVLVPAMFFLNATLASFVLTLAALMAVVVAVYIGPMQRAYQRVIETEQKKSSLLIESLAGIRTVKSLALENAKRREWDLRVAEAVRASTAMQFLANQPQTLLAPLEKMIYAGSLGIGAWLAIQDSNAIYAGTLVAFTMIATRATQPIVQIASLMQQVQEIRGAVAQVASVVNREPEPRREGGARPSMRGGITFQDVRFFYPDTRTPALDGISFEIAPGSIVGIMGRSGSGKTTVTRLLQGLHQSYEGLIKLDGIELREIDLEHLRSHMGVVLQDSFLFKGTIRENILIASPEAGVETMIDAARMSGAEEFIERLPKSYDTSIEEGAANLSGGQKQRLAIARALVTDPPLIVFDEATSALDPDSEAIINRNLRQISRGRTVIVISHRLASLTDCDQILVMEKGRLIDAGRHDDLLDRCDVYNHLWHQQNRHLATGTKNDAQRVGTGGR